MEAARCSKDAIRPRTVSLRHERQNPHLSYVRDRDFDFDPPAERGQPIAEHDHAGNVLGWHWCRHEIENYLVDPAIATAATGWAIAEYEEALVAAAETIRHYAAARWAIGRARRQLPPHYELRTRPDAVQHVDLQVPPDLSEATSREWAIQSAREFAERSATVLAEGEIQAALAEHQARLEEALGSAAEVLVWYPGKDLLAALAGWLAAKGMANAGVFRARMRDWVRANPDTTLAALPEWQRFRDVLNE